MSRRYECGADCVEERDALMWALHDAIVALDPMIPGGTDCMLAGVVQQAGDGTEIFDDDEGLAFLQAASALLDARRAQRAALGMSMDSGRTPGDSRQ